MPRARACAGDRAARTFRWESKTAGGKGGNLQSFGNRGLFDDGATRRKPAETPCRNFARATGRIFLSHLGGPLQLSIPTSLAETAETPPSGRQRHRRNAAAAAIVPP